jgi:hypothetical protein
MMKRIISAIIFTALSAALAAAPAHSLQQTETSGAAFADVEFRFAADASLVFTAGEYGGGALADLDTRFEWEGISDNGTRWGLELGGQVQRDSARRGFGNRAGAALVPQRSLATTRYNGGWPERQAIRVAASRANLFLKTSWGDWRAGLTPGAAATESVTMPTSSATVRLDGGPLSPHYGAAIRTLNAASGLGPSLIYSSPRIVGIRASASFTPETSFCGLDFCRQAGPVPQLASPVLENVVEAGLSFDHTFRESGRVELGVNLAIADPQSVVFTQDYTAYSVQGRWSRDGLNLGLSWLSADNAVSGGNYDAVMAAVRYDRGDWSVGAEWAQAEDDFLGEQQTATQITISRLTGDAFTVTFGLHEVDTEFRQFGALVSGNAARNGTGAFLEIAFRQ